MINKLKNKINADIHLKELLKGSSIAFVLRILGIIAGYVFTLLITRGYGAEAMGVFALSFTLLQISSVIGRLGMDTALLRFVAEYSSQGKWDIVKDIYKKAIKLVLPFSIIVSVLVFFLSPYIAEFIFKKPHLTPYFKIASIGIVPFVLLFIHTESLRGLKKIKDYMLLQQAGIFILASALLGLITFLLLTNNTLTITNNKLTFLNQIPISTYIFSVFIISIIAFIIWKKQLNNHPLTTTNNKLTKTNYSFNKPLSYSTILSVSIPMLFSSSLALIMGWTDTIMLGMFRTEEEVGVYNVALRVASILILPLMAINTITSPKFSEFFWQKKNEDLNNILYFSSKLNFMLTFILLLFLLVFSRFILNFFGQEFTKGIYAMIILSLGYFFNSYFGNVGAFLNMTGNQNIFQKLIIIAFIINVILNFILIPCAGTLGAAVSTVISMIIWNTIGAIYIKIKYNLYTFYLPLK